MNDTKVRGELEDEDGISKAGEGPDCTDYYTMQKFVNAA